MSTTVTDPLLILELQNNEGPAALQLLERDRLATLVNTYLTANSLETQALPSPTATNLIAFFAPYFDNTVSVQTKIVQFLNEFAKYFSFQRININPAQQEVFIASKPIPSYAAIVENNSSLRNDQVQLSMPLPSGSGVTLTWVVRNLNALFTPASYFSCADEFAITVYNALEDAFFPGNTQFVNFTTLASALQTLMIAAGFDLATYEANPWVTASDLMGYFTTQLTALTTASATPDTYVQANAMEYFFGNYQQASITPNANPVYVEYWNGSELCWVFYAPSFAGNRYNVFQGIVGQPIITVVTVNPQLMQMLSASNFQVALTTNPLPARFEAQSLSNFFSLLSTARTAFQMDHSNGYF